MNDVCREMTFEEEIQYYIPDADRVIKTYSSSPSTDPELIKLIVASVRIIQKASSRITRLTLERDIAIEKSVTSGSANATQIRLAARDAHYDTARIKSLEDQISALLSYVAGLEQQLAKYKCQELVESMPKEDE